MAESYSLKRGPAKPPISTHPAFPAIVALWFAALLGFGSLVLPIALLERAVTVTGIAALMPSAAPPLGFTAHAGIALAGSIAGAVLGLLLARKIAKAHAAEPVARSFGVEDAGPRRPISAHDELGEESLAPSSSTSPLLAHKRRSLAIAEDNRRSTYLESVPLPGHSAEADLSTSAAEPRPAEGPVDVALPEPLELGEFSDLDETEDTAPELDTDPALEALRSRIHVPVEATSFQDHPMTESDSFDQPAGLQDERQEFRPAEPLEPAADARDPLPFAPPSLRRLDPMAFDEDEADDVEDSAGDEDTGPMLSVVEFTEPDFADDGLQADRPLDELGLVQLAARLGTSLKKRKERLTVGAPAIVAATVPPIAPTDDFEAAEPEEAARAIADFFAPGSQAEPASQEHAGERVVEGPVVPAPLRSFALDDDEDLEDETLVASFSLPLATSAPPVSPVVGEEIEDEADEAEEDDAEYTSLLAMKNPFVRQQDFVRVEEPERDDDVFEPTVTFPQPPSAQSDAVAEAPAEASSRPFDRPRASAGSAAPAAPRDAGDAERSLRDALATLQRMSGAA